MRPSGHQPVGRGGKVNRADLAGGSSHRQATGMVAVAPGWAAVELIKFLWRRTGNSPWLVGAVIAGEAIVVLRKPERRRGVGKYGMPVPQVLGERPGEAQCQGPRALVGPAEGQYPGTRESRPPPT